MERTFNPTSWIERASWSGLLPVAIAFSDGKMELYTVEPHPLAEPVPVLDDDERALVLRSLVAMGWLIKTERSYRAWAPAKMGFDPVAWIEQADYAGMEPTAGIYPCGTHTLSTYEEGSLIWLKPIRLSTGWEAERARVIETLIGMGRVEYFRQSYRSRPRTLAGAAA